MPTGRPLSFQEIYLLGQKPSKLAEVSKLPEQDQEAFAAWILQELASERRWEEAFVATENTLTRLADEALAEHCAKQTSGLDPERL